MEWSYFLWKISDLQPMVSSNFSIKCFPTLWFFSFQCKRHSSPHLCRIFHWVRRLLNLAIPHQVFGTSPKVFFPLKNSLLLHARCTQTSSELDPHFHRVCYARCGCILAIIQIPLFSHGFVYAICNVPGWWVV